MSNWVQRRADEQRLFEEGKGEFWERFVGAIHLSMVTANRLYAASPMGVIASEPKAEAGVAQVVIYRPGDTSPTGKISSPLGTIRFIELARELFMDKDHRLKIDVANKWQLVPLRSDGENQPMLDLDEACAFFLAEIFDQLGLLYPNPN